MSKRTIRIVDLLCKVTNMSRFIATTPYPDEVTSWSYRRDKFLTRLKGAIAALTPAEIDLIERKYELAGYRPLSTGLREVGIEPRW